MISKEEKEILKKIATFDYLHLHDKHELLTWITKNEKNIRTVSQGFENLNKYANRQYFYNQILTEKEFNFDLTSKENIHNIEAVFTKYCLNFLQGKFSELQLSNALSFFWGNCQLEVFEALSDKSAIAFWNLLELTEMEPRELSNLRSEIIRECKTTVAEHYKVSNENQED